MACEALRDLCWPTHLSLRHGRVRVSCLRTSHHLREKKLHVCHILGTQGGWLAGDGGNGGGDSGNGGVCDAEVEQALQGGVNACSIAGARELGAIQTPRRRPVHRSPVSSFKLTPTRAGPQHMRATRPTLPAGQGWVVVVPMAALVQVPSWRQDAIVADVEDPDDDESSQKIAMENC